MTTADTRMSVLVIDDDESLREALALLLEDEFRVVTAATGPAGLAILAQESIPLVLLDLGLPGMHGLEVLHYIKAHTPTTAVVILSAAHDATTIAYALQSGATYFLPKPYDADLLCARLHMALAHGNPT